MVPPRDELGAPRVNPAAKTNALSVELQGLRKIIIYQILANCKLTNVIERISKSATDPDFKVQMGAR